MSYPSALTKFHLITTYAKCKNIVLFLDYDGTLSPIVDNPDHAFMSVAVSWFPTCTNLFTTLTK